MRRLFLNACLPKLLSAHLVLLAGLVSVSPVQAAITADIANTKHNFSASVLPVIPSISPGREASATSESQICAFCHTPHGATDEPKAPLWNRQLNNSGGYTVYDSTSLESPIPQPGGKSKLCLSCHDGTIALLPALPSTWTTGSVKGLRARNGIVVDIDWKDGKVTNYRAASPKPVEAKVRINGETRTITTAKL